MERPLMVDRARLAMMETCGCQSSFGVRYMPRYRSLVVGKIRCLEPVGSVYAVSLMDGPRYLGGENIITSVLSASVAKPLR
jgi:hypothetical protein